MFVPLHVKSEFSPAHSAAAEELVHRAGLFGIPAVALTDVENLYGQVRFHRAARSYGIRPITGIELRAQYQAVTPGCKSGRLVLLARDRLGYESLCRIITRRRSAVRQRGYDPLDCLEAEPRGVFFLSDDASVIEALLQVGVAATDIRFLLVRPCNGAPPRGVRTVADPDIVMADPADRDLHLLRMAICRRQEISELNDVEPRSLVPPLQLRALYRDVLETLHRDDPGARLRPSARGITLAELPGTTAGVARGGAGMAAVARWNK